MWKLCENLFSLWGPHSASPSPELLSQGWPTAQPVFPAPPHNGISMPQPLPLSLLVWAKAPPRAQLPQPALASPAIPRALPSLG